MCRKEICLLFVPTCAHILFTQIVELVWGFKVAMIDRADETKILGRAGVAFVALISGLLGALVTSYTQSGHLYLIPAGSFQDLAAIMLGAVAVIVTTFGVVLAIAALWGFAQMKREAVRMASEKAIPNAEIAALNHVKQYIESGEVLSFISSRAEELVKIEIGSPEMRKLIEARVDKVALGNPSEDELLERSEDENFENEQ